MHTDRRAEHGSGVPSARMHAACRQACRTEAGVPHAGRHLRAARKQKKVDLNTSIVKVRIQNLEPLVAPLHVLLDRQSGVGELQWRVIGSLPFRAVHGC